MKIAAFVLGFNGLDDGIEDILGDYLSYRTFSGIFDRIEVGFR